MDGRAWRKKKCIWGQICSHDSAACWLIYLEIPFLFFQSEIGSINQRKLVFFYFDFYFIDFTNIVYFCLGKAFYLIDAENWTECLSHAKVFYHRALCLVWDILWNRWSPGMFKGKGLSNCSCTSMVCTWQKKIVMRFPLLIWTLSRKTR